MYLVISHCRTALVVSAKHLTSARNFLSNIKICSMNGEVIHLISRSHGQKNPWFETDLSKITRPVAAIKSPRYALLPQLYILLAHWLEVTPKTTTGLFLLQGCVQTLLVRRNSYERYARAITLEKHLWHFQILYFIERNIISCQWTRILTFMYVEFFF